MVLDKLVFSIDKEDESPFQPPPNPRRRKCAVSPPQSTTPVRDAQIVQPGRNEPGESALLTAPDDKVIESIETDDLTELEEAVEVDSAYQAAEEQDEADGAVVLDPISSARHYYRDPVTGLQRQIWRPGDGDGDKATDYYDKPGAVAPLEKRWRFYQSRTGPGPIKRDENEPPKYVILDDRAAHEILSSNIPRQFIVKFWNHDFGGVGSIRTRRPHRGRGAIGDADAIGDDKYHFTKIGSKGDKYYFTREKNYTPIIWRSDDPSLMLRPFQPKKRQLSPPPKRELRWNQHGHNQFTPKDQLVKYGAPHKGTSWLRYRKRLNTWLPEDAGESGGRKLITMTDKNLAEVANAASMPASTTPNGANYYGEAADEGSLWSNSPGARSAKRIKTISLLGSDEDDDSTELIKTHDSVSDQTPHRTKLQQKPDYFEQILANQNTLVDPYSTTTTAIKAEPLDSGSYASQLEAQLEEAKETIRVLEAEVGRLKGVNEEARGKIGGLEVEVAGLKGGGEMMAE